MKRIMNVQKQTKFVPGWLLAATLSLGLLPGFALAAATQAGIVLVASGQVTATGADGALRDLTRRSPFFPGDRLTTGSAARAQIKFTDGAILSLKPNSELRIDDYAYEAEGAQNNTMSLVKGGFRTLTGAIGKSNKNAYRVSTPVATIGVRGTLYDADFTPEQGLALAVWDGGIEACNAGGCLELGMGADFRYGYISIDGTHTGSKEPVSEESAAPSTDDESADFDAVTSATLDDIENDMVDEDIAPLITGNDGTVDVSDPTAMRQNFPLTGFASVASARSNSWGGARTLAVEFGRAVVSAAPDAVGNWSLQSATLNDGFINPGILCDGSICNNYLVPTRITLGANNETEVVWGHWYGNDASVGDVNGVPTNDVIVNPGMFVLGTFASPQVVGTITGTASFTLSVPPTVLDSTGYLSTAPTLIGGSAYMGPAPFATGSMSVDLSNGTASGALSFQNAAQATWNLSFGGTVSTQGMDLALTTDAASPTNGSHLASANSALAVEGSIAAAFVGVTAVDGVVGVFDVQTTDQTQAAQGVFVMERTPDMQIAQ